MFEFDQKPQIDQFEIEDDDESFLSSSQCKGMKSRWSGLKVVFMVKGGSVIYVMISKVKHESMSFMNKQLAVLHTHLVSLATKNFVAILKQNSCYDIMSDPSIYRQLPSLTYLCHMMRQNPFTFLNLYLPTRMHPITRQVINSIIYKHK